MNDLKKKLTSFFLLNEEEDINSNRSELADSDKNLDMDAKNEAEYRKETKSNQPFKKSGGENVVAINQKQSIQKPQITIMEPRLHSEVHEVADYLLSSQSVIINFRRMDNEQATKMIDFLMGVTYAIKGDIQRLDEELFVCTPQSVEVNGSDLSDYKESLL